MYHLLMVGDDGYWEQQDTTTFATFTLSRFLEYTREAIRSKFLPLNDNAIAELLEYPALFAYEFSNNGSRIGPSTARLGKITEIRQRQSEVQFKYQFTPSVDPIPSKRLAELASDLDIILRNGENYRSHWAIKDVDIISVLKKNGFLTETHVVAPEIVEQLRYIRTEAPNTTKAKPKVFIVHGRDDGIKNEVARWISRIGLEDVVLHEQPNLGRTIITKFQQIAEDAAFAIVLMTPDDVGGLAGGAQAYRARQNVIFELGYFLAKLGPERVAALVVGSDLEKPSDYAGVAYIAYDQRGAWKLDLAREFSKLGIPFDPSKTF